MQELNLYRLFTDRLNDKKIPYAITGSVAAIIYGEPRMTHDIDLIIEVNTGRVEDFIKAFPDNEFYCPPAEVSKIEILKTSRGHCNIIHHKTGFWNIHPFGKSGYLFYRERPFPEVGNRRLKKFRFGKFANSRCAC